MLLWNVIMTKHRLSSSAKAREMLQAFEDYKPLSKREAGSLQYAVERSQVPDGLTRLVAGYARLLLTEVTE